MMVVIATPTITNAVRHDPGIEHALVCGQSRRRDAGYVDFAKARTRGVDAEARGGGDLIESTTAITSATMCNHGYKAKARLRFETIRL